MLESAFLTYIQKFFPGIVVRVVETLNGTKTPLVYFHRRMLKKEFSVTGKWESINTANTQVMADLVAMNSELPLKKRDSITRASGNIPKMGQKLYLNEEQLTELDTMVAQGVPDTVLLAKLFADTPKTITAVYERNEYMFLLGLSTGTTLVDDDTNVGTGVRVDFGYKSENKFGCPILWTADPTNAKPFDDINRVLAKAKLDGNVITTVKIDQYAFNAIANTKQAKELFAFSQGFTGTQTPSPSLSQLNPVTSDRFGFTFEIIERSVRVEKNGVQTAVKPWQEGMLIFLTSDQVGSLIYARLAEENRPVAGVSYEKADDYILVSKYRKNEPLSEYTTAQARVVPVISGVDEIYQLDCKVLQA